MSELVEGSWTYDEETAACLSIYEVECADDLEHSVTLSDPLAFHLRFIADTYGDDSEEVVAMFDTDNALMDKGAGRWLMPEAELALERNLRARLPEHFDLEVLNDGSDVPVVCIEIYYTGDADLTDDRIYDVYWPAYAAVKNALDPGTFGTTYAMWEVRDELIEAQDRTAA